MSKKNQCKYCGSELHYSITCFLKPRRPIKSISEKTYSKKQQTDRLWYKLNPPDGKGLWYCYLQIAQECPYKLTASTITLEHVRSKARYPQLKFVVTNLRAACGFCNKIKGSKDIEELAKTYPHLQMIADELRGYNEIRA